MKSIGLGALATLAAAACVPNIAPISRGPRIDTTATLRVGVLGDLTSLDPHQLTPPVPDVIYQVWDRLIELDDQVKPKPALADSWEFNADGSQLQVHVRPGVRFHSGRDLTSDDVKWTLMRLKTDPIVARTGFYSQVEPLASVDIVDTTTLVLKSEAPWPGIFGLLSLMSIVDQASMSGPDAATSAIGTGPFKFVEWVQGDHVRLVRNPAYWQSDRPRVGELYVRIFQDPQAMVAALEGNAIDVALKPPFIDAVRLRIDPRFRVQTSQIGGTRYALLFNALNSPTDQQQFRQALLYAIDRQRIVKSVLQDVGEPRNLPFAPGSPAYDAARDQRYAFDLTKAQALVAASGVAEKTLDFNFTSVSAEWAAIGQIYQADLARIGVTLNLRRVDPVALVALLRNRTWNGIMTGVVPLGGTLPTQQAYDPYYSPVLSFSGFKSDMLTQLADELEHTVDPIRQQQVYARWSDYVLDEAWAGSVATSPPMVATTPGVHDLEFTQLEMLDYRDVQLEP